MTSPWVVGGVIAGSYLLGSVSPSVFLGRLLKGIDVRQHGSGNAGTTNAFRVLGTRLGACVMVCDILKGVVPVLVCRVLGFGPLASVGAGLAAIVGHNWSIFLRGRGGKGIATTGGVIVGLMPITSIIVWGTFGLVVALTRIVSVGSLSATVVFVAATLIGRQPWPYVVGSACAAVMIFYAHRGNIRRLLRGEEPRIRLPWDRDRKRPAGDKNNEQAASGSVR